MLFSKMMVYLSRRAVNYYQMYNKLCLSTRNPLIIESLLSMNVLLLYHFNRDSTINNP